MQQVTSGSGNKVIHPVHCAKRVNAFPDERKRKEKANVVGLRA